MKKVFCVCAFVFLIGIIIRTSFIDPVVLRTFAAVQMQANGRMVYDFISWIYKVVYCFILFAICGSVYVYFKTKN